VSELLRCRDLVIGYAGRGLLSPLNLSIGSGEFWVVSGQNGSGKTTWVRTLLGLLPPVSGSVSSSRSELRLCYVGQRQHLDPHYPLAVKDVVAMGLERGAPFSRRRSDEEQRVQRALVLTSSAELAERSFHELSEGQKQRVLLARVHAAAPDLAVLDEPTSAMDASAERQAWQMLKQLRDTSGVTLVVVTHALAPAAEYADRAIAFDRETKSVVTGTPASLLRRAPRPSVAEPAP
jgi:zinc transport system ATP-binding protein